MYVLCCADCGYATRKRRKKITYIKHIFYYCWLISFASFFSYPFISSLLSYYISMAWLRFDCSLVFRSVFSLLFFLSLLSLLFCFDRFVCLMLLFFFLLFWSLLLTLILLYQKFFLHFSYNRCLIINAFGWRFSLWIRSLIFFSVMLCIDFFSFRFTGCVLVVVIIGCLSSYLYSCIKFKFANWEKNELHANARQHSYMSGY